MPSFRRVAVVAQLPPPVTGLAAVSLEMVRRLTKAGLAPRCFNVSPPISNSRSVVLAIRFARASIAMLGLLLTRIGGTDTLYMPTDSNAGLVINSIIAHFARILNMKLYLHHHNFSYINEFDNRMNKLIKSSPKYTSHIFLCEKMQDQFISQYSDSWSHAQARSIIIGNAFLIPQVETQLRTGPLRIGHLSNLTFDKGTGTFISLFRNLRSKGLLVEAVVAGPCIDGDIEQEILSCAAEFGDSFIWTGPVYGDEKSDFFRSIDLFVFPSIYKNEAQPLVVIEAQSFGLPVLSTNIGCLECDINGAIGQTFPPSCFEARALAWIEAKFFDITSIRLQQNCIQQQFWAQKIHSEEQISAFLSEIIST